MIFRWAVAVITLPLLVAVSPGCDDGEELDHDDEKMRQAIAAEGTAIQAEIDQFIDEVGTAIDEARREIDDAVEEARFELQD